MSETLSGRVPLFLLAAGGTGGHVFPAEALTRELKGRGAKVAFVTDNRGNKFSDELAVPVYRVKAAPLGKGLRRLFNIVKMGIGVMQAKLLLHRLKPAAVVGFGGYPSVPLLYAAAKAHIPIILHEQNAVLGRANKAMLPMAKVLATSFPKVQGITGAPRARVVQTGNPVRPAFATLRATPYPEMTEDGPIRLLVLGGSLGSATISQVVPKALALLPESMRRRIIIAQQCRPEYREDARAAFAAAGVVAEVSPFFKDVPERMAQAHLIIGRSGGGAIAELTAIGRPSILIPFPHGHAGEQKANAEALAQAGGAWLIPEEAFTPEALAVRLESLFALENALSKTAMAARAWGTIAAADELADCLYEAVDLPTPKSMQKKAHCADTSGSAFSYTTKD
ncbi:MAG: undecaprenyldiphospho-muramoylpentapeptide beta-N-acetylglucosaminyltransferase [Proteobacteria bacterium]|jgi:UDP-N-acetylglucosamine--N-acetylmuramyl-(pentapeptide) pyrophosphoryl-undecaprenol N-acetylglucosamine transferase|nr:undecaprenyldiphospho-muramoylpentapeptide beta-N-acetylglucosaminyltransferase [Alphaproteobacteria bacterium]NCC02846.1 undecaprenyldiphospho-muramoylpentapeptide beta-N-acetylglucosaminyltransferase [Pseudomonadota bacterium]